MTTSTTGVQLKTDRRWLATIVELISSMRFAISLLSLLAIASIIGTVMKQNEPMPNYVNQFGPFWFDVFGKIGLYSVYSSWWFLLILAFLVASTSLCITRNAPKMLKDMRSWRENVREQSLRNFRHKAEWDFAGSRAALAAQLSERIIARGYKVKLVEKDQAILLAAKQGAANKWGYIFAHSAIVIICIGGLLDSDLPIRFQGWFQNKTPFVGNGVIADIPAQHRLGLGNPTFRGNTLIPEGASSNTAIISQKNGVYIQDLPFTITLKRFIIDFYSTGMPKLFASEVEITDHESGKKFPATIKVNQPLVYKGLSVYQSSFEDGGTKLKLTGHPMSGAGNVVFPLSGVVGNATPLRSNDVAYSVEWSGFRPFNVENMSQNGQDLRSVKASQSFVDSLGKHLGSGAKSAISKDLKNVGPSVQYKLRDKTGQAREYQNYMMSVKSDDGYVFLAGMRDSPSEQFRYLRIPADDNDTVDEWMRLRAAIQNPVFREQAAQRYAQRALPQSSDGSQALREQLAQSAIRGMTIFSGDNKQSGYVAVSRFLERIPSAEQEKAAGIFMKILNGSLWDLWQIARQADGLPVLAADEKHARFLQLATNAYADTFFYGAPIYLQLKEFDEVKASVLQVTRAPGQNVVYLGCLFLVLGVFSMLYIRERRLWIWITTTDDDQAHALMAMSSQRITLDFENEFENLKQQLPQNS
ncbi:cytochrome c biogenesis protein ResB [Actimicrobium sp. CCC2.4]|uniref:cytochrome c biogenesis protein ResB n=1 Tax=Actimicrobium sp. CCC2.4 TaxID=3048606 RepID=UPI002AC9C5D2|nr:cytochrome c biogenesis protein ResB [Actimicrobium sp. CCC2.4]MEB0135459.1 cytochrome c biogenesis protein ResB [Actimicrobium sp. CCC2.4]WPX32367.1 cytochrome c biogenesis protein ResB [Actimicrobium sp. CCC2.4]